MSVPISRLLRLVALFGASLLIVALGTASRASAATIYACEKKKGGAIRIVSAKTKCKKKSEVKLSWNTQGPKGASGPAGKDGNNGANGKDGSNGLNGAAAGFSASKAESVSITSATSSSPQTIVSKTLPAGSYIATAKVQLLMSATRPEGYGSLTCSLTDTPTGGGGAVSDSSTWTSSITVFGLIADFEVNTIPLDLAASSANSSTMTVSCYVATGFGGESGGVEGTFSAAASNARLLAVQTSANG